MAQAFLDAGKHAGVVARLDVDHPVGRQPRLSQRGGEKIGAGEAPQYRPDGACRDPGGEQCRRRAVHRAVAMPGHLMQRRERQPATRQMGVERGQAESQRRRIPAMGAFDPADLGA